MTWMMGLILGSQGALSQAPAQADPPAEKPVPWYLIPNSSFDTDDGLGFGFRGELQHTDPDLSPYRDAWVLQGFSTLRGYHNYLLRYERLGLGTQGNGRITTLAAYRAWTNDQFYGLGGQLPLDPDYIGDFDADDLRRKRYRYTLVQPHVRLTWLSDIPGPLRIFASSGLRFSQVRTYENSLLEEQQPFGMEGGWNWQLQAGLQLDTRDREIDPRRGLLLELSGRYNPPIPGGAGIFGGPATSLRGYLPLGERGVLAARLMGEALFGEIPFYELNQWGGAVQTVGFGGYMSLRGIRYGRYRAPGKAMLNTEVRIDALRHSLGGKPFVWQLVPFVDLGTVFLDGGGTPPLHTALGVGLRPIYDQAFVGRMDLGFGREFVETDSGVQVRWTPGFYLTYEHLF